MLGSEPNDFDFNEELEYCFKESDNLVISTDLESLLEELQGLQGTVIRSQAIVKKQGNALIYYVVITVSCENGLIAWSQCVDSCDISDMTHKEYASGLLLWATNMLSRAITKESGIPVYKNSSFFLTEEQLLRILSMNGVTYLIDLASYAILGEILAEKKNELTKSEKKKLKLFKDKFRFSSEDGFIQDGEFFNETVI